MGQISFDELLKQIPAVAKAVNAFSSEAVQQQVFSALLQSLRGESTNDDEAETSRDMRSRREQHRKRTLPGEARPGSPMKKRVRGRSGPSLVPDLNLRPKGKESLTDFIAKKKPKDNQERLAAIVHYLQKILGVKDIGQNHIYTAFKEINMKVPSNIQVALSLTAKRKGWIDTKNMSDLTMTVPGENFVEHDLPAEKLGKSK